MTEPTIICPQCKTEIKLTESLAAPLLEATKRDFEQRLAQKDADAAKRDAALREREAALAKSQETFEEQVADKLKLERGKIAAEEARKAKLALSNDLEQKSKELLEIQGILKQKDEKLAEAQKVQADLLRKQRELDDAKRELDLTVEKRVQEGLTATRDQAKKKPKKRSNLKSWKKSRPLPPCKNKLKNSSVELSRVPNNFKEKCRNSNRKRSSPRSFRRIRFNRWRKVSMAATCCTASRAHSANPAERSCGNRKHQKLERWLAYQATRGSAAGQSRNRDHREPSPTQEVETFEFIDGVWVTHPKVALPVAIAMRNTLMEVAWRVRPRKGSRPKWKWSISI